MWHEALWILDEHGEPIPATLEEWALWFGHSRQPGDDNEHWIRRVAISQVGDWEISTVFLGLDHGWGDGPPLIFESMVFGPEPHGDWTERYSTRAEAEAGHKHIFEVILNDIISGSTESVGSVRS